ncbi:MAG: hypothetical protein NDI90_04655 [Nitrospira sp. BO4]|jgi:hypothetical protein|nr:hypothetical protein [Nitrospira sp. BO4]
MRAWAFFLLLATVIAGCSGDKHLPSSNPPEYDPNTIYTTPGAPFRAATLSTAPTELESLRAKLDALEMSSKEKGERKKLPFDSNSLQPFKGAANPCEILSRLAPGLGSAQLFAGHDGAALKKALGPEADDIARRMDEHLAKGLKYSLGSGAADCPISVRPRKSSSPIDRFQPARAVLASTASTQPFLLAQTTIPETSQDDYDVNNPPMRREDAPPGWVGYRTTDTMTRIGKPPRAEGIYESYDMVIAPKAKQCPHLEGPDQKGIADGTFEWSFLMYRRSMGQAVLYRRHVVATLKGEVDDDAKLKQVEYDVTVTLQHIGTELVPYSQSYGSTGHFTLDQRTSLPQEFSIITVSGFSEAEAQAKDAQLLGTLTALVAYFSGQEYYKAQQYWNHPNTCVDIVFNPATKTQRFAPNKSYQVKTELRTKKDQRVVPAKFKEARERPREGNGTVSPREDKSQGDRPVTFTYQAPGTRVRHSGFRVNAVSRAGVAETKDGDWELAPAAYVLEFKSHIVQEPLNIPNPQFGMGLSSNGFDAHVQATIPLQHTEDRGWVGEGVMQYATRTTTLPAQCEFRVQGTGTTTFHVNGGSISIDPEPFAVNLIVLPGQSGEVLETHCTSGNTPEKLKELFATQGVHGGEAHGMMGKAGGWSGAFNFTRFRTFNMAKKGYEIGGWTPVRDSDVIAKKTITVNCGMGLQTCREETMLTLKQADEPGEGASPAR